MKINVSTIITEMVNGHKRIYDSSDPYPVKVKGLMSHFDYEKKKAKIAREARAEKYDDEAVKACIKATGLTPEEYQHTYHMAWNA